MMKLDLEQLNPKEYLARYLFHKNQFSAINSRVKYVAFMPAPNGETSVFRISNLSGNGIWKIGDTDVAQKRGLLLLGRADIHTFHIFDKRLKVVPDNNPPQHANIVGWPKEKSEQKLIAMELAENAQLHLR